ncbi:MAG: MFS transporter [Pseudobutyrivibrio sp.]|nr:MFS transporter [Pseudobutyrivibrio sp.]
MARSCAGLGSAIVTVITVISVSAIGTAINNSSASNTSYTYDNTTVYFAKMDESEVATGDILKVDSAVSNVTADEMEFDDNKAALSFNESNSNYVVTVDGVTRFTNDGSKLDFTKDAEKDSEASVAIFVQEEEYSNLSSGSEVTVNVVSTKQVERYGFKYFSLIIAVLFIICTLVTCVVIKEKSTVDVSTPSVGEMFKSLIKNDQAITMVVTIVLVNSAAYITANLLIYFFKYDLAGPSWETNYTMFITFIGAVQIIAMMLFFPLLRKYFTTMKVFDISILSGVIGYLVLLGLSLFEINNVFAFFVPGFFIMSTVGLLNVIVTVFLANTVDYGQLKNGHRDESVIFSMQTFVVKLASGIAAMVVSITLSVFHISDTSSEVTAVDGSVVKGLEELLADIAQNGGSEVSNNDIMGLRMTMTLAPIVFLVIAFLIFKKYYMLTDQELEKISAQLKERQND